MADEKLHPFQNFDASKLTLTPRGDGQPARDTNPGTTTATEELDPDLLEDPNNPVDKPGTEPKETPAEEPNPDEETPPVDPEQTPEPEAEGPVDYSEDDFKADVSTFLGETTNGRLTSPEQITAILTENDSLKEQLKNKQLEFPSERAKKLYEFAVKNDGNELASAGQYLRVQSLDLAKLSPKEKQFEGFVLGRPDLTREEAKEIFELRYAREFADIENDVEKKDQHKVQTMEAERKILAMQEEFTKVPERTASAPEQISAQEIEKITTGIDQSLSDFGGVVMQFGNNPEEQVKIPQSAEEVSAFRETLINPNKFLERIMDSSMVNGKFSNEAYRDQMFRLMNIDRIITEARSNGVTVGQLAIVKDRKNAVLPKGTSGTGAPPKKSYAQTLAEAVKAQER